MRGFREAIVDAQLVDLDMDGYPFTWKFGLGTPHALEQHLVRALATRVWLSMFPKAQLRNLLSPKSDHSPLLLTCVPSSGERRVQRFKFENAWLAEPELAQVVHEGWD